MQPRQIRVRVFDRKGEQLEDRVFRRVSRAIRYIDEQIRLGRELKIGRERELVVGGRMRWPAFSDE